MFLLRLLWAVVRGVSTRRADLVAENLALRQQLIVLHRKTNEYVVRTGVIGMNQVSGRDSHFTSNDDRRRYGRMSSKGWNPASYPTIEFRHITRTPIRRRGRAPRSRCLVLLLG